MTDNFFYDTNLLVYLFDTSQEKEQNHIHRLILYHQANTLCISAQVLNEFINITTTKIEFPLSIKKLQPVLLFIQKNFTIFPISMETTFKAITLKQEYSLSFWDALIVASAMENSCTVLYSEDMHHGQKIDNRLEIINPFK